MKRLFACALFTVLLALGGTAKAETVGVVVKPVGEWFVESHLTNAEVTVLYHWGMTSKFIVYHAGDDVAKKYSLHDADRVCKEARARGFRCSAVAPIAGVPRSKAVTLRHKDYRRGRYAYREYRVGNRRLTVFFYGSWFGTDNARATRDFDRMVRETHICGPTP